MNSELQIKRKLKPALAIMAVSLVFVCMAMGQLSSNNLISDEIKYLDKILSELKWENESKYLLYPGSGLILNEKEEIQNIEIWMVDLSCWSSNTTDEMKEILCTQEIEYTYSVEDWMLHSYSPDIKTYLQPETEDDYHVENWMYNMQEFGNMDQKSN